jgi:ferredoxin
MLVINPDECIDCGVCEPECPEDAIRPDTDEEGAKWVEFNGKWSQEWAVLAEKKAEFDVAMAGADRDEAKADLTAAYQADQAAAKAALASKRASQKDALRAKLVAKKAAMLAQQRAQVEEVAPEAVLEVTEILEAQAAADELRRQAEEAEQRASAAHGEVAEAKAWLDAHREQRAVAEALQKVRMAPSVTGCVCTPVSCAVSCAWRVMGEG